MSAIDQITNALADQKDIEAVHIVSHGSEGSLKLGADVLNEHNLETFSTQIKQWGNALTANGDILLYGCDVAAGESGENFVKRLSEITGADVAASTDKTGNAALGGDWELEKTTGAIEAGLAFSQDAIANYAGVLALEPEYTWAKQLGGSGADNGNSIAVDSSGNVYTTGNFNSTVDFDPSAGTFNLTSAGGSDSFISKLNPDGTFAWTKQLGGIGTDNGSSIAVDSSGNVYT
ncbi:MAG: DUF4347 domain-containing protein, partial [Microcoleus sp.]